MKKTAANTLTFLLLLSGVSLHAQPSWQWGQRVGIQANDIAVDGHGNSYVVWTFEGSYPLNGEQLTGYGAGSNLALTSFSCSGAYRWTRLVGVDAGWGSGGEGAAGIAVGTDTLGGVYVTGGMLAYIDSLHISGDTILPPTYERMLLLKYDTLGNFQWVRLPQPDTLADVNDSSFLWGLSVTPDGDLYLPCSLYPGSYGNGAYIAPFPVYPPPANGGNNVYTLKYDRNGNCFGGMHFDLHYSGLGMATMRMARDPLSGHYYMDGSVGYDSSDTLKFGATVLTGDLPAYVTRYDSLGEMEWVRTANDSSTYFSSAFIGKPAIDNEGNVYATGYSYNGNGVGDFTFHNNIGVYGFPILVKLNPAGDVLYATNASSTADNTGEHVAFANGTVAVTGEYGGEMNWGDFGADNTATYNEGFNAFLARFNATTGAAIGFDTLSSSLLSDEYTSILLSDKQGNFYVGGTFPGTLYAGPSTIYNQSSQHDGFIAKFGSANCNCNTPAAHYSHGSLLSQANISFAYDGSAPVDSVAWDFGDGESGSGNSVSHSYAQGGSYTVCATAYTECGSNMYCETLQIGDVGIGEIAGFASISVYPNPATQTLVIERAAAGTRLDVYNTLGGRMLHTLLQGDQDRVDVSHLAPGVYLMRFTDQDGREGNTRFVKQ